jgi:tRNA nucleotidyltransferase/poly(A) polymerase
MKPITKEVIHRITNKLVNFGYTNLTEERVQGEVDKIMSGDMPSKNIIGMFAYKMLIEDGFIEE